MTTDIASQTSRLTVSFFFVICLFCLLGKQIACETDDIVIGLEEVIDVQPQTRRRYGTAGPGPGLFKEVWAHHDHVFAAEGGTALRGQDLQLGHPARVSSGILNLHPVEVLVIEEGGDGGRPRERYWTRWLDKCHADNQPDYVVLSAPAKELVAETGLHSKEWRRRFQGWNYEPHYWFLRGHEHGGVVRQDRCMVMLRRRGDSVPEVVAPHTIVNDEVPRSARNMLRPCGVPRKAWMTEAWTPKSDYPEWITAAAAPCLLRGETKRGRIPIFSPDGCLPDRIGALIETERGVRRVQGDELAKAKGVPLGWLTQNLLSTRAIHQLTDLHIWAAVASSLSPEQVSDMAEHSQAWSDADLDTTFHLTDELKDNLETWEWSPPDLSPGGVWHQARVTSLEAAIAGMADADLWREAGLRAVDTPGAN